MEEDLTEGQELRAYQLIESTTRLHGMVSLGALQRGAADILYISQTVLERYWIRR